MLKKTKIVCTIGPASEDKEKLKEMMLNGMNVARLNFSHGSYDEHQIRIDTIKEVREELGLPIAIMLDTKGPEIRLKNFKDDMTVELNTGDKFTITTRDILGDQTIVAVSYTGIVDDLKIGDSILIDDGLVELKVLEKPNATDLLCEVLNSGEIKNHKGVNLPNIKTNLPAVTEKDKEDILFGIKNDLDFIAASFIRKAEDVNIIRKILEDNNGDNIDIISKIENAEGIDNMDEIIKVSDGIMVARGDMGVEVKTEEIPLIQKEMIKKCNEVGKPVITATQMLDSMMRNPRPTRAEVTDVANAILDGTSAIMLSGETAAGKYPIEAVKTMHNIAVRTEESMDYRRILYDKSAHLENTTTNAISKSTCTIAQDLGAQAILTASSSGNTPKAISKFKPKETIIAVTMDERVSRKLSLEWGVETAMSARYENTDELFDGAVESAIKAGYVKEGDLVVITAGVPVGISGTTNLIKVHTIGKILLTGTGIGEESGTGKVVVGNTENELLPKFEQGDILVCQSTDRDMIKFMEKASAVVVEEGGFTSHAAIVAINLNIPTIVGVADATTILKDGDIITVDASSGQIYKGIARVK
ncbi:MAG: pyruvate kinase [Tissierellia bacterium]|nr:pyruvate kinase [Tissierellia bacterium]